jgi:predicted DsbA family dithiol-disulfide isomerase
MKHHHCLLVAAIALHFLLGGYSRKLIVAQAPAPDVPAAVVNGRTITQAEVDEAVFAQVFALQQQIYAIRKVALENLVSQILLNEEARRRGLSSEELKRQLVSGTVVVSAKQVDEVYAENAAAFAAMSPDEARLRLRLDLESQEHMRSYRETLAALKKAAQISWLMEEPRVPPIGELNAPALGPPDAKVTIVEFSDFQCPFCRNSQAALKELLEHYPAHVRLVFKHRPLDIHAEAFSSAQAAFCAGQQGNFWPYHDELFRAADLSPENLAKLALNLHLDPVQFRTCLNSEPARAAIQNDVDEAKRLGIDSTPTFLINGKLFRGALSFADFKAAIEPELKARGINR